MSSPHHRARTTPIAADFRVSAVHIGLALTWGGLLLMVLDRIGGPQRMEPILLPLAAGAVAAMALTVLPWRRLLRGRAGDPIILAWLSTLIVMLPFSPDLSLGQPVVAVHLGLAVFAGLLLPRLTAALVFVGAVGAYVVGLLRAGIPLGAGHAAGVAGIVGLGVLAAIVAAELETRARKESLQLQDLHREEAILSRREAELDRSYSVLRSIAAGGTLTEVVPEICRRVAEAVAARVGMIFVYRPQHQALEILTPIWLSSGVTQTTHSHLLPLTEHGIPQRVFIEGIQAIIGGAESSAGAWGDLVAEYGLVDLVVSRLRIEDRDVGVLLVANRITGPFNEHDAQVVEALAAPAALVLDHIWSYQEATETSERMAELARMKTDFVSVVSHELLTPLTSIIGVLKTVLRPEFTHQDSEIGSLLRSGANQADRLKTLIEDLLVISQIDNRAIPVRHEVADIRELIRSAVDGVAGSEHLVSTRIAPVLPPLLLDKDHTRRVLVNLIGNSVKYGEGSPIEVTARLESGELSLTVVDHGPGLPFEMRDRAFDAFTQLKRKSVDARGGVGLGLAIARGLVGAMGGTIRYEPTVGGGAAFRVLLPFRRPAADKTTAPPTLVAP